MSETRNPKLRGADIERMAPDHPYLRTKKFLDAPTQQRSGTIWDLAFGKDEPNWSAGDRWSRSGIPAFPWDTVAPNAIKVRDERNPWSKS
jgi:hypothetical protein